jgi:DNA-binding beta-propeller fold protein YncE
MSQPDGPRGIEQLVRDTLVDPRRRLDPPPGHYESVGERIGHARRRRNARRLATAVGVVAVLAAGGVFANRTGTGPGPSALSSGSATPSTAEPRYADWRRLPAMGTGEPVDVAASDGWFYVLEQTPGTVLRLDPGDFTVGASAPVPDVTGSLAVDAAGDRLWVGYTVPTGETRVREFVASTLAPLGDLPVADAQVFQMVAFNGELWLGTSEGLFRVGPGDQAARPVPVAGGVVFSLALDPTRHRLLVAGESEVTAIDPGTLAVTHGVGLALVKETIAVVAGQVWVGGYTSGEERRIYHLDPTTLQVAGTSPINDQVGPGAIVSAGVSSLWVRDGADQTVSCLDPVSGSVRRQWQRGGDTVVSLPGAALTVSAPNLYQLALGDGCAG